jgi:hypothetical protein
MTRLLRDLSLSSICLAALASFGGCDGSGSDEPNAPPELRRAGGPGGRGGPGSPGGPGPGGPPGKSASSPEIRQIMIKLNKGSNSLTSLIGSGLKAEPPAWETIGPQAKEYAQLAADLGKHEPAKGSKESWSKLVAEYSGLATELDKAAQAKDKAAVTAAQEDLASSCMACHRQHRGGPGMGGGMRGGPAGLRPGGGPPGGGGGAPQPSPDGGTPPGGSTDQPK